MHFRDASKYTIHAMMADWLEMYYWWHVVWLGWTSSILATNPVNLHHSLSLSHSRGASLSSVVWGATLFSYAMGYILSGHVMQPFGRRLPSVNMGALPAFNPWDADSKTSFSIVWCNSGVCPRFFEAKYGETAL